MLRTLRLGHQQGVANDQDETTGEGCGCEEPVAPGRARNAETGGKLYIWSCPEMVLRQNAVEFPSKLVFLLACFTGTHLWTAPTVTKPS